MAASKKFTVILAGMCGLATSSGNSHGDVDGRFQHLPKHWNSLDVFRAQLGEFLKAARPGDIFHVSENAVVIRERPQ